MRKRLMMAVAAVLACGTPMAAPAQEAELTVSGGRIADQHGTERTGFTVAPALGWTDGLSSVAVSGSATLLDTGDPLWGAGLNTRLNLVQAGFVSLEMVAGGRMQASQGWRGGAGRVSPRVGMSGLGWSASAGPLWGLTGERVPTEVPSGGIIPGGTRTEYESTMHGISGASVEGRVVQGIATMGADWTRLSSGDMEWEDVGFGASLIIDGVLIGGTMGTRIGADRTSWYGASAAVPVGGSATLLLEGGRFPSDVLLERPGGRYLTVGLRIRDELL